MPVHVKEIHTDVSAAKGTQGPATIKTDGRTFDDRWRESQARAGRLTCRVEAEGFSD